MGHTRPVEGLTDTERTALEIFMNGGNTIKLHADQWRKTVIMDTANGILDRQWQYHIVCRSDVCSQKTKLIKNALSKKKVCL